MEVMRLQLPEINENCDSPLNETIARMRGFKLQVLLLINYVTIKLLLFFLNFVMKLFMINELS